MPKLPYLDEVLTENPTPFDVVDIGQAKLNKNEKKYYPCVFKLKSTGATSSGCIYQAFLDQLGLTGETLFGKTFLISKEGTGFPKMTLQKEQTGNEEIPPPPISNYEEVKREKVVSENIQGRNEEYAIRSDSIGLRGLVQAFISRGDLTDDDCLARGVEMHDRINKLVESRHS